MPMLDTYPVPKPLSYRVNALEKVHVPCRLAVLASLANVLTRIDRQLFKRTSSEYISLLSRCLPTILA